MKFVDKLNSIYEGWKNLTFEDKEIERIAKNRALHCAACPSNKVNICTNCGCYIPAKIRTKLPNCPLKKFKE